MITYDYRCVKCKRVIEIVHSIKDDSKRYCPDCNGELQRVIGKGSGVIFKGAGFHCNDYPKRESED
jgi:putative FmdB family regulatory protein